MSPLEGLDRKMPILVVDDLSAMRRLVKNCLKQLGFENVTEAEDGGIALSKLDANQFELIISDWNMPHVMGIDLLRAVRSDDKHKSVPFLMITAESQKDNVLAATKAGVSNFIIKPFTTNILRAKLEAIFARPGK